MEKETKQLVKRETGKAIRKLYEIFVAMDELDANLLDLSKVLNEKEVEWIESFLANKPTYEELDNLDQFLTDLRSEIIKEEKE